jgi:hypothetical protein
MEKGAFIWLCCLLGFFPVVVFFSPFVAILYALMVLFGPKVQRTPLETPMEQNERVWAVNCRVAFCGFLGILHVRDTNLIFT